MVDNPPFDLSREGLLVSFHDTGSWVIPGCPQDVPALSTGAIRILSRQGTAFTGKGA